MILTNTNDNELVILPHCSFRKLNMSSQHVIVHALKILLVATDSASF